MKEAFKVSGILLAAYSTIKLCDLLAILIKRRLPSEPTETSNLVRKYVSFSDSKHIVSRRPYVIDGVDISTVWPKIAEKYGTFVCVKSEYSDRINRYIILRRLSMSIVGRINGNKMSNDSVVIAHAPDKSHKYAYFKELFPRIALSLLFSLGFFHLAR